MINYIRSEAAKKYLQDKHIELDDKVKYALIAASRFRFPMEEIEGSLLELAAATDDEEIKAQAPLYVQNENAEYELLAKDSGPSYYYKLQHTDSRGNEEVKDCYRTLDLAVKAGVKLAAEDGLSDFEIVKDFMFSTQAEVDDYEDKDSPTRYDFAKAVYRADGKLLSCSAPNAPQVKMEDPIENRFYIIPHPFRRGDIVRHVGQKKDDRFLSIVLDHEDDEMSALKKRIGRMWHTPEWYDMSIRLVDVNLETGLIWDNDEQELPTELEYYPIADDTKDLGERVMLVLSDLIKGEPASLQYIQQGLMKLLEEYDNKQRYHMVTGIDIKKSQIAFVCD